MEQQPPKWADRFLAWYCNPDLLEEIQGDARELYFDRLRSGGKFAADLKYYWDIVRFLRASNIKRAPNDYRPGYMSIFWNLDFRIALRNASRNKFTFVVKVAGLVVCLAFTLTLTAFVLQEFSYDKFHPRYRSLFRVGSEVEMQGVVTRYAVSPFQMGPSLAAELPEIDAYTRLLHVAKPVFKKGDESFSHLVTIQADSNFLRVLGYRVVLGGVGGLDDPNMVVITESTSRLLFGEQDPIGQTLDFYGNPLEVSAVVADEEHSHLRFDAVISWATFQHMDAWDNINAYTYLRLHPDVTIEQAGPAIASLSKEYLKEMITEYNAKFEPIIENIADIHLSDYYLDEDVAVKRRSGNVYILIVVIVFFLAIGLINYHNLVLAELGTQLRKFGILRVFGGVNAVPSKVVLTDAALTLTIVVPGTLLLMLACLNLAGNWFSIKIEGAIFMAGPFLGIVAGFIAVMLASTRLNAWVISRTNVIRAISTTLMINSQKAFPVRKYLVSAQLCFSLIMLGLIFIVIDQFQFINTYDKGIEHSNTIVLTLPDQDFSRAQVLIEELRTTSGVAGAEASSYFPAGQIETRAVFHFESPEGMQQRLVQYLHCSPGFFNMMKVRMAEGEVYGPESASGRRKFLINQTAAREFGWTKPVGKLIVGDDDGREGDVVGVVQDFHLGTLHEPVQPLIMFCANEDWGVKFIYIKTTAVHSADLVQRIEQSHGNVYPDKPFELHYLDARYAALYEEDQQVQKVLTAGLVISALVTCLGVFGISALMMILRTREMGIRKVVGAARPHLFFLHMKMFLKVILVAVVVGAPVIYYLGTYWLTSFAYHIAPEFIHLLLPGLAIIVIVLVTAGWHAQKSARVNPVDVLRQEN